MPSWPNWSVAATATVSAPQACNAAITADSSPHIGTAAPSMVNVSPGCPVKPGTQQPTTVYPPAESRANERAILTADRRPPTTNTRAQ